MSALAKLTPPRLGATHPRERLFACLDAARAGSGVWITGPPGAGKTTLVASYLRARKLAALWYQIDAGDSDPATLFYFLREAVPAARAAQLPLLAPEYMPDVEGFARRFFRVLFERRPRPLVLVFDNFHDAAAGGALQRIVRAAMSEAPAGVILVVISRQDPSAAFARLAANRQLLTLSWEDLRLRADESAAIIALHHPQAAVHAAELHQRAGGWAAAITLLLRTSAAPGESAPKDLAPGGANPALPLDAVPATGMPSLAASGATMPPLLFDYLASEVFDHAPAGLRALWLRTAQLPHFTAAMAGELSANPNAAALLDRLWRRRYFIDRSSGDEPTYQYHALFRAFLRDKLQRSLGAAARQRQARRAAQVLERHGDPEAALTLYREAEDWSAAAALIRREAKAFFAVGRLRTVDAWIAALPAALTAQDSSLLFWRGCCRANSGAAAAARRDLADAFERHAETGDVGGQCLTAAAMIESYFLDWNGFAELDRWIATLRRLLAVQPPGFADPALELRVQAALLLALAYRTPQDPLAPLCAERVWQLCRADIGPTEKLAGATALLQYLVEMEGLTRMQLAVSEFGPLAHSTAATPMQQLLWHWSTVMSLMLGANGAASAAVLAKTRKLCTDNGLSHILNFMRLFALRGVLAAGDFKLAQRELDDIGRGPDALRANDLAFYHFMRAWLALLEHRPHAALEHGEVAAGMAPALGSAGPVICSLGIYSQALIACGEFEHAAAVLAAPKAFVPAAGLGSYRFSTLLFEADALLHLGRRDEGLGVLRDAFATGRASGLLSGIVWLPEMIARLCAAALDAGIEVEYVERLIRARGLLPPGPEAERWPWPLRIYALGRFTVVIDGQPLEFGGKAQRRPLELLRALLAQGGRAVEHGALLEQLWPDLEGDAARNAFDLALHRLRKLLCDAGALGLEEGRLRLDARRVWVDAWAFERLCSRIDPGSQSAPSDLEQWAEALLRLYRGPLLAGEEAPWALTAQQRLRHKFEHKLDHVADELQRRELGGLAVELYRRGVEIEPQSEGLQRGLIAAYRAQGRLAEAATAYRRFRDLLATRHGLVPGADIQALYRSLQPPEA